MRLVLLRLLALFRHGRAEQELNREIESHLGLIEEALVAKGMSAVDAKLTARRAFGGVDQTKERQRDVRMFRWIDDLRRDSAYAVRSLLRSPGFTVAAVLTLSIGIGASAAIYSVVDTVLLQPLPFPDGDRLVRIDERQRPANLRGLNYSEYLEWRARSKGMSGIAMLSLNPQIMMRTSQGTVRMLAGFVSTNFFEVLGARSALGRTIVSSDDDHRDVVLLSHHAWHGHFHGDPNVVGRVIEFRSAIVAGRLFTIVGVLPEDFDFAGDGTDIFLPAFNPPGERPLFVSAMIGRLFDGTSIEAAAEEAQSIGNAVRPPRPADAPALATARFAVEPLKQRQVASFRPALTVLLTAVGVMLLIVCANVSNLLLARGTVRQREISVRLAIGAARARIFRQLLTESVVLAAMGGIGGAVCAAVSVALIKALATVESPGIFRFVFGGSILPRAGEIAIDSRLLLIAFVIAAIAVVVFGVLPALHLSRGGRLIGMPARGIAGTRRDGRLRSGLVVGQLVLATVLLVGAGLLATSFLRLASVEKGYDATNVLAFQLVFPPDYSTARKASAIESVLARLRSLPGAQAAGFSYAGMLLLVEDRIGTFVPPGRVASEMAKDADGPRIKSVSHGYLEAYRARVLDGRLFREGDAAEAPPVVVINKRVATKYFGAVSPVGQFITWENGSRGSIALQVVGVVDDVRQGPVSQAAYSEIFLDYRQLIAIQQRWGIPPQRADNLTFGFLSFALRMDSDPAAATPLVRQSVNGVDANVGIDAILPMDTLVGNSVARQRFYAVMLTTFAAIAGLLAAIGIYGVLAYTVVQRTQEIGIRMALGAERAQVMSLILRHGVLLATIGIGVGIGAAFTGARYLQSLLFGIEPRDPATFISVALMFAAVATLASYLPARRATKVDPMVALRVE